MACRTRFVKSLLGGIGFVILHAVAIHSQESTATAPTVVAVRPLYLPPEELLSSVGVSNLDGGESVRWESGGLWRSVQVRRNLAANLIVLSGSAEDVAAVETLIRQVDIAPRQIAIDARIVEINESKTREIGFDWDRILRDGLPRLSAQYRDTHTEATRIDPGGRYQSKNDQSDRSINATSQLTLGEALRLLDESGAATSRNVPRILTLNNRRATILDGQRVTYVVRYSSYTNLYVTDTMDAGLTLSVLPSLGESGYLTLNVRAELTSLLGDISGSPIKDGQMVDNTVIVRDGETVLLGGFERTVKKTTRRRFPLLGHVLPFLFSRESTSESLTRSFVVLTPHVVDLAVAVDPASADPLPKE